MMTSYFCLIKSVSFKSDKFLPPLTEGELYVCYTKNGLKEFAFPPGQKNTSLFAAKGSKQKGAAWLKTLTVDIEKYFAGEQIDFASYPVDLTGYSCFFIEVLQALRKVPYGQVISYSDLADLAGKPGAGRAVGNVMGNNPLPLLIPCHRVIQKSGRPGGYGGGLLWKKYLLSLEGVSLKV